MNEQDDRMYIDEKVNPIFQKLMLDILINKPESVIDYMAEWIHDKGDQFKDNLKKQQQKRKEKKNSDSSDQDDDDDFDEDPAALAQQQNKAKTNQRSSVSSEVFGAFNKKEDVKLRVIKKDKQQNETILARIKSSFLFSNLSEQEFEVVVDAMNVVKFSSGQNVITQNTDGDSLYVVEKGQLDCYKKFKDDENEKHLKVYQPGESFGELALLYNTVRQASIIAKTDVILFELDRQTFNHIVKDAAQKKREKYEDFLNKVQILQTLDSYERSKVADAIKEVKAKNGEQVICEGEEGDDFFFVLEGNLVALKGSEKVFEYEKESYFGELALIHNDPRAATIVCTSDCTLLTLDKQAFKRILGPLTEILERNKEMYDKYVKK